MQLLIFDFDGVIIDTETPDYNSWQEMFKAHGCELPLSAWADCIGARAGVFDPCLYLEETLGRPVDRDTVETHRRKRYLDLVAQQPLRPGVARYVRTAKALGLTLGVASSASRRWVVDHLARFELLDYFDCLRTVEDVARAKPDPDLFLAVLAATHISARQAVAFEDSPNGIRAARRAGIACIAVPNPITCQLPLEEADFAIESFDHVPLTDVLSRLEKLKA